MNLSCNFSRSSLLEIIRRFYTFFIKWHMSWDGNVFCKTGYMPVQVVRCISALKRLIASRADFRNEGSSSVALYYLCGLILSSDETLTISSHVTCCTKTTCFLECIIRICSPCLSRESLADYWLSKRQWEFLIADVVCINSMICIVIFILQSWLFF